jgi:hypothetical protein
MTYQYHDESIVKSLPENTVFVFGSNMAGLHAGGAARTALEHFGAVEGVGRGWSGQSYAMANVIARTQRPTIVMAHNKTLAAQLYGEFKAFFPI